LGTLVVPVSFSGFAASHPTTSRGWFFRGIHTVCIDVRIIKPPPHHCRLHAPQGTIFASFSSRGVCPQTFTHSYALNILLARAVGSLFENPVFCRLSFRSHNRANSSVFRPKKETPAPGTRHLSTDAMNHVLRLPPLQASAITSPAQVHFWDIFSR
jgi:hypothetical protein